MKFAIVGSRQILDEKGIHEVLDRYNITHIISGGAKGVDSIAYNYAIKRGLLTTIFKPDWRKYGKRAGYVRNQDIIDNSDYVLAFWDGSSHGTKHSIDLAKNTYHKPIDVWIYDNGWILEK